MTMKVTAIIIQQLWGGRWQGGDKDREETNTTREMKYEIIKSRIKLCWRQWWWWWWWGGGKKR